jgi:hypothetical protein
MIESVPEGCPDLRSTEPQAQPHRADVRLLTGDQAAQVDLANLVLDGAGRPEDPERVARWFAEAAAAGDLAVERRRRSPARVEGGGRTPMPQKITRSPAPPMSYGVEDRTLSAEFNALSARRRLLPGMW